MFIPIQPAPHFGTSYFHSIRMSIPQRFRLQAAIPITYSLLIFISHAFTNLHAAQQAASSVAPPPPAPTMTSQTAYKTEKNIPYYETGPLDDDQRQKCVLDIYYPETLKNFPTVVWFHGGGLVKGGKYFPSIRQKGIALIAVGYRLSPQAKHPDYLQDAAAATAWTLKHIERYGGSPPKVFISGSSAGGWLAAMIAMDPRWLAAHNLSNSQLAGMIPVSGQMTAHFHDKKLRGDTGPRFRPIIDEFAPLYHAAKTVPPVCLIVGDRQLELKARVEENELMAASLRALGHRHVEFYEMQGLSHTTINGGAMLLLPDFVHKISAEVDAANNDPSVR
ncbi:alpha/beta hydrolase [Opitutaceae bacterium TAV4]|nr:alpha/beta hydrolase [Opitutaceae bacterium TAV4]RRK02060.1 alpha/beta hydrolase [Opitutaceae bacterium TAV3]